MKFKVGDRVAVYGHAEFHNGTRVTINSFRDGLLRVTHYGVLSDVHPKQCRRLKKKEPKYFYAVADELALYGPHDKIFLTEEDAQYYARGTAFPSNKRIIKMKVVK